MMTTAIRTMSIRDDDEVFALWSRCDGVGLAEGDSRDDIRAFLRRNPGLSFVATSGRKKTVGAVLSSHDGRRGFLHHLAVAEGHRRSGVGKALAQRCLESLDALGIPKCHIVVFVRNCGGRHFWRRIGWVERAELRMMSKRTP